MRADESWQHQSDDCLQQCQSDMSCSLWMVVHSSHLSQCPSPIQAWRSPPCPEAWPLCPCPGPPGWGSPPSLLESVSCWSVTSTLRWVLHSETSSWNSHGVILQDVFLKEQFTPRCKFRSLIVHRTSQRFEKILSTFWRAVKLVLLQTESAFTPLFFGCSYMKPSC